MNLPRWIHNLSRIDFLNSVGIYLTRNSLSLVSLRKDLYRISVVAEEVREIPAVSNEAAGRQALADAMTPLLSHFKPAEDPLYVCLSPDQTLVCEVLLPQVAEESMQQVLEYEMERLLPFRREELYYDFLPMGKKGDRVRLFLFAVPRRALDWILDVLLSFGIQPAGVETMSAALCNYLLFCTGGVTGPTVVVTGQDNALEMTGLNARSVGWMKETEILFSHRLSSADWVHGPARELFYNLQLQSPKFFGFGTVQGFLNSVTGGSVEIEDMAQLSREKLITSNDKIQAATIPAIGAALRGLREAELQVNLRPESPVAEDRGRKVANVNGRLLLAFLVVLMVWMASYPIKDEIQLGRFNRQIKKLGPSVKAIQLTEEEVNRLNSEVSMLAGLRNQKGEILRVIEELSRIVPTSAYLSILRFREEGVELRGSAENASSLVPLLERSSLLKNVGFSAPTNRGRDNRETFSLKAEIEK